MVAGVHLGLVQVTSFALERLPWLQAGELALGAAMVGTAFAILGILITLRHQRLMKVKLNWIFQAEEKLHLIKDEKNANGIIPRIYSPTRVYPWKGLSIPRLLSTGGMTIGFYLLLIFVDLAVIWMAVRH